MSYGMYIAAEGAQAQAARMDVLSNNLANADTVGFKRELARIQARHSEEIARGLDFAGSGSLNNQGGGVYLKETVTDFSQGPFKNTNSKTDLAIRGDAFFMVGHQDGRKLLTRAGNFSVDNSGRLMTQQGHSLLDSAGTPVVVDPLDANWYVNEGGELIQNGGVVAALALVQPASTGDLRKVGENLFESSTPALPVPPDQRSVASGFLEGSGVQPTLEMMELIETSRMYEANIHMIQHQDQIMGQLVSRVIRGPN